MSRPTVDNPMAWSELEDELKEEIREVFSWADESVLEGRKWAYVENNWLYWDA